MDCLDQKSTSSYSGVIGDIMQYGDKLKEPLLRDAVLYFYRNSWKKSTTRSYGTGQRKWAAFTLKFRNIPYLPCPTSPLAEHELALAYFAAHLVLTPSITRGTSHTSHMFVRCRATRGVLNTFWNQNL